MKSNDVQINSSGEIIARVALDPKALDTELLGQTLARLGVLETWIEEARQELRNRLIQGDGCNTWHLEEVRGKRTIHDVPAAWSRLIEAGVDQRDLIACVQLPIGKTEEAFAKTIAEDGAGKAEAGAALNHLLDGCISRGDPTAQLKRSL